MDGKGLLERGTDYYNKCDYTRAKVALSVAVEKLRTENEVAFESRAAILLASTLRTLNKPSDALQVLESRTHLFAPYVQLGIYTAYLSGIIKSLIQLKKLDKARERVDELTELTIRLHGKDSADHGLALAFSGELFYAQNDLLNAKEVYEHAVTILPKNDPTYVTAINGLANVLHQMGEFERCLSLREEAIKLERRPVCRAVQMRNTAATYAKLKRFDMAVTYVSNALEIYTGCLDKSHPYVVSAITALENYRLATGVVVSDKRMCNNNPLCKNIFTWDHRETMCSGCNDAHYCTPKCQLEHWPVHKLKCKRGAPSTTP
jgi:tetratricopeptide (TPR) repeat protein